MFPSHAFVAFPNASELQEYAINGLSLSHILPTDPVSTDSQVQHLDDRVKLIFTIADIGKHPAFEVRNRNLGIIYATGRGALRSIRS